MEVCCHKISIFVQLREKSRKTSCSVGVSLTDINLLRRWLHTLKILIVRCLSPAGSKHLCHILFTTVGPFGSSVEAQLAMSISIVREVPQLLAWRHIVFVSLHPHPINLRSPPPLTTQKMAQYNFWDFGKPRENMRLINDLKASKVDTEPREAPPPATPVQLPEYSAYCTSGIPSLTAQEINGLFCNNQNLGITKKHIEALGVQIAADVPLSQLFPQDFLPPTAWLANPATTGGSDVFPAPLPPPKDQLRNGADKPEHEAFYKIANELRVDKEAAFRTLQHRPPLEGQLPLRLAYARVFYQELLYVAEYWDTSSDRYHVPEPEPAAMDIDQIRAQARAAEQGQTTITPPRPKKLTYTGRRIGNGQNMPLIHREKIVAAFVEPIAWAFGCRVEGPQKAPKFRYHNLMIPVQQTDSIYCSPKDQQRARARMVEGPLVGITCRHTISFRKPDEAPGDGKGEIRDLLHEIAMGLSIAQKRDWEGRVEVKHWEGKWWCTQPRWGGLFPRGSVLDEDGHGGQAGGKVQGEAKEEVKGRAKGEASAGMTPDKKRAKKEPQALLPDSYRKKWRLDGNGNPVPPPTQYERRIIYQHVGQVKGSAYDDVSPPIYSLEI